MKLLKAKIYMKYVCRSQKVRRRYPANVNYMYDTIKKQGISM